MEHFLASALGGREIELQIATLRADITHLGLTDVEQFTLFRILSKTLTYTVPKEVLAEAERIIIHPDLSGTLEPGGTQIPILWPW